ncbi:GntR family transcriptional regulator [Nonomuraea sp. SBT364]|uniref:GntR family transcriptional regulator n=1 Tax=Nonomuraea sp. SBT364 TaxID=1580530 RepID=UPI00066BECB8|nr:GntR family transcriptional regulator [Nonomuraea sp. SBT364]
MLDPESDTHLYLQISEIIRARVVQCSPGDPVASEADIQREFGVARTTARRAIRRLRDDGLVHTVQGEGTYVGVAEAPRAPQEMPLYQHIAAEIVQQISCGALTPRRAIPGEAALVRQYDVARETVRRAMALLREQGWIYTVPQRGSYVSPEERWPAARKQAG